MISMVNANIDALYAGSVRIKVRYFFSEKFHKWCVTKVAHCILLKKKHNLHLSRLFCCNRTCYCVNMVSVMSASRSKTSAARYITSALRYQSGRVVKAYEYYQTCIATKTFEFFGFFSEARNDTPNLTACCTNVPNLILSKIGHLCSSFVQVFP